MPLGARDYESNSLGGHLKGKLNRDTIVFFLEKRPQGSRSGDVGWTTHVAGGQMFLNNSHSVFKRMMSLCVRCSSNYIPPALDGFPGMTPAVRVPLS